MRIRHLIRLVRALWSACRCERVDLSNATAGTVMLHATCVAAGGRAALIRGRSGSGKSGLALQLLALGAGLVSDDRTLVTRDGSALVASCPGPIRDRIEARGIGLLHVPCIGEQEVICIVDMDDLTSDRMPDPVTEEILDLSLPLIKNSCHVHFPAALLLYLRHGIRN